MKLILASASPRRLALLEAAGVHPVVRPTECDETLPEPISVMFNACDAAETIARRKIRAALADPANEGEYILSADTVVEASDGELLGKPADDDDARRMLHKLSGSRHFVHTGVAVAHVDNPFREGIISITDTTVIRFRPLTDAEIDAYVASGESRGKAGAYAIQETGDAFVISVEGDWDNVVGLPVKRVDDLLRRFGHPLSDFE